MLRGYNTKKINSSKYVEDLFFLPFLCLATECKRSQNKFITTHISICTYSSFNITNALLLFVGNIMITFNSSYLILCHLKWQKLLPKQIYQSKWQLLLISVSHLYYPKFIIIFMPISASKANASWQLPLFESYHRCQIYNYILIHKPILPINFFTSCYLNQFGVILLFLHSLLYCVFAKKLPFQRCIQFFHGTMTAWNLEYHNRIRQ